MDKPVCIYLMITAVAGIIAAVGIILYRKKTRLTMERLNAMLDSAINGGFSESVFDESMLSAVEAKMAHFLSVCSASSQNLYEEKNKIKSLISDISHQTKTPIANILLYSQLLGEYHLPEDGATCVKALSAQAEKLSFLIDALVKTSRLETGIITVSPQPEAVRNLIYRSAVQIKPKADAKNLSVITEDTDIAACFDLKWTAEAVTNILENAVKYTENGGSISIKAAAYELFCRIDIADNGIGIAQEEHNKIFRRFYRSVVVSHQEGVGIGLYLAREIVSAEGGYIKVASQPGCGSTFSVFLPMP